MLKRLQSKKGFTIIEIMVVIALIGILALVLVPKFAGIKDNAKLAGVTTNVKIVEAYASSVIDQAITQEDLRTSLNTYFHNAEYALVNPITNATAISTTGSLTEAGGEVTALTGTASSLILLGSSSTIGAPTAYTGTNTNTLGCVSAIVFKANGKLQVQITGFDGSNREIVKLRRTISQ